ncbi:MAG: hypothetical protein E7B19_10060 [Streptococcus mitis]|nr:hypothetical protein [Streptococcus mitis]
MEFNENAYRLIISETVQGQLRDVKDYISANYFSEQAGANTVKNILYGLERLEVFPEAGFDADEYSGFAFGMGPDRIAMLKYGIEDIRHFYTNDVRFLDQFKAVEDRGEA